MRKLFKKFLTKDGFWFQSTQDIWDSVQSLVNIFNDDNGSTDRALDVKKITKELYDKYTA